MFIKEIPNFVKENPEAIIQFVTTNYYKKNSFYSCCTIKELYEAWVKKHTDGYSDSVFYPSRNDEAMLSITFYVSDKAYPVLHLNKDYGMTFGMFMCEVTKAFAELESIKMQIKHFVTPDPGSYIYHFADKAVNYRKTVGEDVLAVFNDHQVIVTEDMTSEDFMAKFNDEISYKE